MKQFNRLTPYFFALLIISIVAISCSNAKHAPKKTRKCTGKRAVQTPMGPM